MPKNSGVYFFLDKKGSVLYIGKAKNLQKRVSSYFTHQDKLLEKIKVLISKTSKIKTVNTNSEIEAFLLEAECIKKYRPRYNTRLTDGKAYPLIRITVKDIYPKVLIVRKTTDKNSLYFGPFPNTKALRLTLGAIRKIFPFQSVVNHPEKICLYYHLNLCPCSPINDSPTVRKEYQKNIKHLILFLKGNAKKVIRLLEKERNKLSKEEKFEQANSIQEKIQAISLITLPKSPLISLLLVLNKNKAKVKNLQRIECFDISNIQGKFATGSMVVFLNGEKEKSMYRKFKIRSIDSPNDFAMIEEILQRRMKHLEWPMPNLIIIDGGKGQVGSVLKVLKQMKKNIPVIGLAKKEEAIITSGFKEIKLPKSSEALKLTMRIRDEAHRFAISYHKKLREKSLIPS